MAGLAVILLSVGMMLSDLTQDVRQTYEKSLTIALVIDPMDLNRYEVRKSPVMRPYRIQS